jgi:hypothetical protein
MMNRVFYLYIVRVLTCHVPPLPLLNMDFACLVLMQCLLPFLKSYLCASHASCCLVLPILHVCDMCITCNMMSLDLFKTPNNTLKNIKIAQSLALTPLRQQNSVFVFFVSRLLSSHSLSVSFHLACLYSLFRTSIHRAHIFCTQKKAILLSIEHERT